MAPPHGHPRWGGKKKGTRNRQTIQRARMMAEALAPLVAEGKLLPEDVAQMMPLQVLLLIMRQRVIVEDWHGAVVAAQAAAPYTHAKLTIVDQTVRHVAEPSDAELEAELASLRAKVQQARSPPPLIEGKVEAEDTPSETATND
jgi:hypothetical protein